MTQMRSLTLEEMNNQSVYSTELWSVLLPERPISSNHLMIVINRAEVGTFTEITDIEAVELRDIVKMLANLLDSPSGMVIGYNLFSNNGDYSIGQHLDRFHQHIFIRTQTETESPYVVMADGRRWTEVNSEQWVNRRNELRSILN